MLSFLIFRKYSSIMLRQMSSMILPEEEEKNVENGTKLDKESKYKYWIKRVVIGEL